MGSTIRIREASSEDIPALALLMTQLGYPTTGAEMASRFEQILPHPDYKTLIAEVNHETAGMIGLVKNIFYEKNGQYLRITALVVRADHRGRGIGKKLLEQAEIWARESSATSIILNSGNREERKAAHAFYERNGYAHTSLGFTKKI